MKVRTTPSASSTDRNLPVAHPDLTFAVADHYAPTRRSRAIEPQIAGMMDTLRENTERHGICLSASMTRGRASCM